MSTIYFANDPAVINPLFFKLLDDVNHGIPSTRGVQGSKPRIFDMNIPENKKLETVENVILQFVLFIILSNKLEYEGNYKEAIKLPFKTTAEMIKYYSLDRRFQRKNMSNVAFYKRLQAIRYNINAPEEFKKKLNIVIDTYGTAIITDLPEYEAAAWLL